VNTRDTSISSVLGEYAGLPVLVLGASGFVGRWVARILTHAGARLYLPARDCAAAKRTFTEFGIEGELLKLNLLETGITTRLISEINPAITFNLAGYGIDRSETSDDLAFAINARLPEMVCEAMSLTSVPGWSGQRIVHAGTAMEYGSTGGDLKEDSPTRPASLYGKSKLAGTEAVSSTCRQISLPGVTARLFGIYGPGESSARLLPSLIADSKGSSPIALTAGLHKRDFTYVEDVAEGLVRLGVASCQPGDVVNVATGTLTSIRSFVGVAARGLGIGDDRLRFGALPTRPEEMQHDPVNCERLVELTGWRPPTGLLSGIRKTIDFRQSDKAPTKSGARLNQVLCELF
jgi:UDP-glucose 4-epimerase